MSSRWPLVLAALCVALSVFCASQWVRESELRAELLSARVAERELREQSAEARRLGETYAAEIRRRVMSLTGFDVIRYAQKANSNIHLLRMLRGMGVKVDAVSLGEIERALALQPAR